MGYRISGQSVEIFEIRPDWRGLPHRRHESAVAKAILVRSRNVWRVFWQRRDLKDKRTRKAEPKFAAKVGRALRRAAKDARRTARMHGVPIYVWKDGKIVALKP